MDMMKGRIKVFTNINGKKDIKNIEYHMRDTEFINILQRNKRKIHINKKRLIARKQKNNKIKEDK